MGAGAFHGRVRDGIGCRHPAIATRSSNTPKLPRRAARKGVRFRFIASPQEREACVLFSQPAAARMTAVQDGGDLEPVGRLGPVSSERYRPYTSGLST